MFFLFRAFFWLGLIMTIILWGGAALSHKPGAGEGNLQNLRALAGKGLDEAKTRLQEACLQRPKLCIEVLSNFTRNETQKPAQSPSSSATASKVKAEGKRQSQAAP